MVGAAEGGGVDEGGVCQVEFVFHDAQSGTVPGFVEFGDEAEVGGSGFGDVGDRGDRVAEANPDVAVAIGAGVCRDFVAGGDKVRGLGNVGAGALGIVAPAVVGAFDTAVGDFAEGEFGGTVAAAIGGGGGVALGVAPEDDRVIEEGEGVGLVVQI